jgi:hypothetical protein
MSVFTLIRTWANIAARDRHLLFGALPMVIMGLGVWVAWGPMECLTMGS